MNNRSDAGLVKRLGIFASSAAVFSMVVGLSVLAGWTLHIAALLTWGAGTPMAPNAAACFVLAGLSLWLLRKKRHRLSAPVRNLTGKSAAAIVTLVGLLTLAEHLFTLNLGIDRLLLLGAPTGQTAGTRILMSPVTAGALLLFGLALLGIDWRTQREDWPAQFLCLGAALASPFGLIGLVLGPGVSPITVPLPTIVNVFALAAGFVCSRATWALGGLLIRKSPGARLLRTALPVALLVLGLIGWLISKPLLTEVHFTWVEVSVLAITTGALLAAFIGWTAFIVDRSDGERRKLEEALHIGQEQLDRLLDRIEEPENEARLRRQVKTGVAVAVLLTGFLGLLSWRTVLQAAEDAGWVAHTHQVSTTLELALRHLLDVETGARGFALTGHQPFLEPYESGKSAVGLDLQALRLLIEDPDQKQRFNVLVQQAKTSLESARDLVAARQNSGKIPTVAQLEAGKQLMDEARVTVQGLETGQKRLLEQRAQRASVTRSLTGSAITLGSILGVIFLFIAGITLNREIGVSARARVQVKALNADLERRVEQRTTALQSEVAARIATEAALTESEGRLAGIIGSAMDAIITVDGQQRILLFNFAAEKMFRCPGSEAIGQSITRFIPQRFHAAHSGHIHRFAETGVTNRAMGPQDVLWALRADGQEFQIEASISQVVSGGKRLFTVILRDVTERVQAEQAVREAQARITAIVASAMDPIITVDSRQRIALFNAAAVRVFRCPEAEALGQPIERFIPQRFRSAHAAHIRQFGETGTTNRAMGQLGALWALRADGEEFQIEASISQIEIAGEKMFTVILRDVTERKQAEEMRERLAAIVDSSDDAIISKTLDGTITAWNRGAEKVFGYSAAEAVGQPMLMVLPRERIHEEAGILARVGRGQSVEHFETVRVRKDGMKINVSVTISPIRDGSGAIVGASKVARDITERKQAEDALRDSEERLRLALDGARLGTWRWKLETDELEGSPLSFALFGLPPNTKFNFALFRASLHPDDRIRVEETMRRTLAGQSEYDVEYRTIWPDGTEHWIAARGRVYQNAAGENTHMGGILFDITDRREAQEALRESEERFQAMANGIPQLAWMAEADGSIVWYNQRWYEYTGTTFEQMQGWGWQSVHEPDILPKVMEGWKNAIVTGRPFEMEFPLRGVDEVFRTFLTRVMPLKDSAGRVVRWFGTNTDISEHKQAQERLAAQAAELARSRQALEEQTLMLKLVLESMGEGLVAADEQGRFILWNPAAEKILGLGAAELPPAEWSEHYGAFLPDMITPVPPGQTPLERAIRGEVNSSELFVRNPGLKRGGWIEINGSPLKDKNGVVRGGVAAFRDISQRKADEMEIRKLNEDLEERIAQRTLQLKSANNELEAFTYSVSHDLRAPLRHIGGFSKILINEFGPGMALEAKDHLQRIEDAVIRMGLLVDGLLSLARLGRQSLKLRHTELNAVVDQVISVLQPECEGRDVEWRIARLPALECDQVLMGQVFQNLIGNALKYSRGRTCAVIEIGSMQQPGEPAVIFVRDNGAGFNMKYAEKLFGVFQRMHTESEFEGTGVGLATVHRIIQKHGGSIWAEAELDHGATFYFTLGANQQTGMTQEATAVPCSELER